MLYMAWYTKDTVYGDIFKEKLEPSLKALNLPYIVKEMPNYTKWIKNVAQKPLAIKETLLEYKQPIVVLDVDATVNTNPVLFDTIDQNIYDLAYHTLDWATWYNRPSETTKELLTGTMWINYNDTMIKLCSDWYNVSLDSGIWEQQVLAGLLQRPAYKSLKSFELPLEYCYINSLLRGLAPHVKIDNPVVTHYQASREYKRQVI